MIANALLIALAVLLACLFWLMGELKFLVPYKRIFFISTGSCFSRGSVFSSETSSPRSIGFSANFS